MAFKQMKNMTVVKSCEVVDIGKFGQACSYRVPKAYDMIMFRVQVSAKEYIDKDGEKKLRAITKWFPIVILGATPDKKFKYRLFKKGEGDKGDYEDDVFAFGDFNYGSKGLKVWYHAYPSYFMNRIVEENCRQIYQELLDKRNPASLNNKKSSEDLCDEAVVTPVRAAVQEKPVVQKAESRDDEEDSCDEEMTPVQEEKKRVPVIVQKVVSSDDEDDYKDNVNGGSDDDEDDMPPVPKKPSGEKMRMMSEEDIKAFIELHMVAYSKIIDQKLKRATAHVVDDKTILPYEGVMLNHHGANFRHLDQDVQAQYFATVNAFTGCKYRDPLLEDGTVREKNSAYKGKMMCSYYTNMIKMCGSKELKSFTGADGEIKKMWLSAIAEYIDMGLLGLPIFRKIDADDVGVALKHHALCGKCKGVYAQGKPMMNIHKREVCVICRQSCKISGVKDYNYTICVECLGKQNGHGHLKSDHMVEQMLKPLTEVFRHMILHSSVVSNNSVRTDGGSRTPDVVMEFEMNGIRCIIVIENDPNSHEKQKHQDESAKMKNQIVTLLRRFFMGGQLDLDAFRMLVVRFNPNGQYKNEEGKMVNVEERYTTVERLVILRRWLIWWILNVEKVRNFTVMYAFYNDRVSFKKMYETKECFLKVFDAPKAEEGSSNWAYCLDFLERGQPFYKSMNDNEKFVSDVSGRYIMERSMQQAGGLPADLLEAIAYKKDKKRKI